MRIAIFVLAVLLSGCAGVPDGKAPLNLKPVSYQALPGWGQDNFQSMGQAFGRSCERILKRGPGEAFGPDPRWGTYGDWQGPCREFSNIKESQMREFFEKNFVPYEARAAHQSKGLFTGYYEASLNGSRTRSGKYQTPLHKKPADLVMVNLGEFRDDLKGERIAGRVQGSYLKPFESRAEIASGKFRGDPLVWVDNPIDKFFLQIQGSGIVRLNDGSTMRVGYDGQNGHPYFAIGRALVHRGVMKKEEVSLQSIRAWLKENPGQAQALMNENASYIFFRELKTVGPVGAEGIPLTPSRSLAVDRSFVPYGTPIWLNVDHPDESGSPLRQMVVAQDTGGAITGAVRGDYFWGYGPKAEDMAGRMKSEGRYWLLLPRR